MNRRALRSSTLLIFLVLSLVSLLHTQVQFSYASPTLEDFTLFTEADPNTHITITNATYIIFDSYYNEDAYLYSDKGTDNFAGDFTHKIDFNSTGTDPLQSIFWALTNNVDDKKDLEDNSYNFLACYRYRNGSGYFITLEESYGGALYEQSYGVSTDTWYYLLITRSETTFTTKIYSSASLRDAGGTPDVGSPSLPLHSVVKYRYIFVAMSRNTGASLYNTLHIRNLDLQYTYEFTLKGLYDEISGELQVFGVNVTAYFTTQGTNTFYVNGSYLYGSYNKPQYFRFDLLGDREYWLSSSEDTATIYIFDATTTEYTIEFVDIGGVLEKYSFVCAKRYVNGTLHTIEKRQSDVNDRVIMNLIQGQRYNIVIENGVTYTYGEEYFGTDITVEIIIRGLNFPQEIILAYRRVRLYAMRHNNYSSISMLYEDLENDTDHVDCRIKHRDGTVAYQTTKYTRLFNETWTSAQYNITYYVEMDAFHNNYGELNYRATLYQAGFGISPWNIGWLGTIPGMEAHVLIPIFLLFAVAGVFSKVNAYVGAFMATIFAILFTWWGWINIGPAMLVMALVFAVLMALGFKKKKVMGA